MVSESFGGFKFCCDILSVRFDDTVTSVYCWQGSWKTWFRYTNNSICVVVLSSWFLQGYLIVKGWVRGEVVLNNNDCLLVIYISFILLVNFGIFLLILLSRCGRGGTTFFLSQCMLESFILFSLVTIWIRNVRYHWF